MSVGDVAATLWRKVVMASNTGVHTMGRESREWMCRIGCCLVIAAVGLAGQVARAAGTRRPRRVAIVPFQNQLPNTDTDWISVGVAETLATKLAELPGLSTVERTRISKVIKDHKLRAALGEIRTAVKIGKLVGAERVLVGSYAKKGTNIQFNVRVVDVATGVVLNSASVVRPEAKMFDALYALAEAVIESFKKKGVVVDNRPAIVAASRVEQIILTAKQAMKLKGWGTTNLAAYKVFSQGLAANNLNEKIRWYTKAIALDRRYSWAYNNRGYAYENKRDYDRAIRDYNRAIVADPKNVAAYSNRGNAYGRKRKYDRAIRDFDTAIKLAPRLVGIYYNRGTTYSAKGDYDRAIRDFSKAIELDPKYALAYHNRATAYAGKNDYDRAIRDFSKAIELEPKDAQAYYNRGLCIMYSAKGEGDYDRAIREFDRAIELEPKNAVAYNDRAVAYYAKRNYTKAWADVKASQRLGGRANPKFLALLRKASGRDK